MTDEEWAFLEPLIEVCRPPCKVPIGNLRQRIEGILWRHENGAKWRAMPAEYGPWWKPAQTFIDWARLGVWEQLLELVQLQLGIALGMAFLDGTSIRAHHKAAGAAKKGELRRNGISVRRWAARVAASGPRSACSPMAKGGPLPSHWRRAKRTRSRWRLTSSPNYQRRRAGSSAIAGFPPMPCAN
jgi:transposase